MAADGYQRHRSCEPWQLEGFRVDKTAVINQTAPQPVMLPIVPTPGKSFATVAGMQALQSKGGVLFVLPVVDLSVLRALCALF